MPNVRRLLLIHLAEDQFVLRIIEAKRKSRIYYGNKARIAKSLEEKIEIQEQGKELERGFILLLNHLFDMYGYERMGLNNQL